MTTKSHTAGAQKAQVSPPFATVRFTCINPKGSKDDTKAIRHTLASLESEIRNTSAPAKADLPWIKLARIGHVRSGAGCIRHDANILASTGCEIDYDGDKHPVGTRIPLVTAVSRLKKAGVEALVYTTPSDTPEEPHWRAICPFSKEYDPKERARFVARLNGLFDGTLDPASFRKSQAFYFGNVIGKPPVSVVIVEGQRIDLAGQLDAGAVYAIDKPPDDYDDYYEPSEPGEWSIEKLREMVVAIDANIDYNDWIKIGFGIHYETGGSEEGFEIFDTWSREGKDYNKKTTTKQIWKDAKKKCDHPATGWTILKYARAASPPWKGVAPQATAEELGFEKYHDHYDASYDDTIGYTEKEFRDFFRTGKAKPGDDPLGDMGTTPAPSTLRFHFDYELEALPADIDFVQGLLLENSTSTIIGPTGSGKSFFALDLGLHVALGIPWHGRKVEKSGVIIAALEGVGGIRKRYKALRQKFDITESLPIAFAEGSFDVRKGKATRDALIAFAKEAAEKWKVPVRWIVIDTLNRGMAGGQESDSADMGAFREGMDYLRRATGANVCTIHHTGKDESRGGRGSNVLVSDVDTEITTTLHDDKTSVVRLTKQKDGAKAPLGAFELAVVKLGYNDHWGDEVTSCTIEWVDMPTKGEELSASEQAAYAVLRELAGTPSKGVPEDAFRTACINGRKVSAAKTEKDRGRSFTRSYRSLISKGFVEARDGSVFIIEGSFDGPDEGDE